MVGKPLVWLEKEIRTPPFSKAARIEAGFHLRLLQMGETLGMPVSRPMPEIGDRCHELRIKDRDSDWRIVYRLDKDEIVVIHIFRKKTRKTPRLVLDTCRHRLKRFDDA